MYIHFYIDFYKHLTYLIAEHMQQPDGYFRYIRAREESIEVEARDNHKNTSSFQTEWFLFEKKVELTEMNNLIRDFCIRFTLQISEIHLGKPGRKKRKNTVKTTFMKNERINLRSLDEAVFAIGVNCNNIQVYHQHRITIYYHF